MRSLELQRTARIHRGRLNSMFRLSLLRWLPIIAIVLGLHAILAHAAETGATFMVMGGYGHSRLREFILGGVTRGILRSMPVPVLMSH